MKTIITRSDELFIEHSCGNEFSWIPSEDITKISKDNPVFTKCPYCQKTVKITKIYNV